MVKYNHHMSMRVQRLISRHQEGRPRIAIDATMTGGYNAADFQAVCCSCSCLMTRGTRMKAPPPLPANKAPHVSDFRVYLRFMSRPRLLTRV
jgi:hypothetical protein